ncbi:MAG: hypothetical protein KVP17_001812 [Porospora cf. gigantea B]|uniref:uncharacterized protein n=2 Tax=Porospora cf. gigantea B TaxID=2853592 RepID=UPI003571BA36|nr:MAG: hypothetical protein KVP17_001812 [Porospora cf. gigantea B]
MAHIVFKDNRPLVFAAAQSIVGLHTFHPMSSHTASPSIPIPLYQDQIPIPLQHQDIRDMKFKKIGEGCSAQVFKTTWKGSPAALKVCLPQRACISRGLVDGLRSTEEEFFESVGQHEHIPKFYKNLMVRIQGEVRRAFLMEYFDRSIRSDRGLHPSFATKMLLQIAKALDFMHNRRWLHNDVKPDNILCQAGRFVLADFGTVTRTDTSGLSANSIFSTIGYKAPERFRSRNVGPAADMFALGVTFMNCISWHAGHGAFWEHPLFGGRVPHRRATVDTYLYAHVRDCDVQRVIDSFRLHPKVSAVVKSLLRLDPAARLHANQVVRALAEF